MTATASLRTRLLAGSLAWLALALVIVGVLLVMLFRSHIERRFDRTLLDHLEELVAAAEPDQEGKLKLTWEPADPRFKPPLSGWYWEIRSGSQTLRRSASLVLESLGTSGPGPGREPTFVDTQGPIDECLRLVVQDIVLPEKDQPLTILVAGPRVDIRNDVRSFAGMLALSLAALGLTLGGMTAFQVGYGLRPLRSVQAGVNEVRRGSRQRLDETDSPRELLPLVEEVNALLRQREAAVERARAEAGDLAHALKTPIAVISNEAQVIAGERGETLAAETARMRRVVEHHLVRARAAAGAGSGLAAALDEVLNDVKFAIARLFPRQTLAIEATTGLMFAGASDDLAEMIGNLADNAAKWAKSRIEIGASRKGDRLAITVDDDGPGLDEAEAASVLARGVRLETMKPGHGLGLSIVNQLARHYDGRLILSRSPQGGLRAALDLPLAA